MERIYMGYLLTLKTEGMVMCTGFATRELAEQAKTRALCNGALQALVTPKAEDSSSNRLQAVAEHGRRSFVLEAAEEADQLARGNGYDYRNQAFVVNSRYVACSHPASMNCDCFGTRHAGELIRPNADIH